MHVVRLLCLALIVVLTDACQSLAPSAAPTIPAPASAFVSLRPFTADDLSNAVRFRTSVGLSADESWIRSVAANPGSDWDTYATPLTQAEKTDLDARERNARDIEDLIYNYASVRSDWAGMFVDQADHGRVVVLVAGPVDEVRDWITAHVSPLAVWGIRKVRWTHAELQAFADRLAADEAFLKTIKASFVGIGIDDRHNRVLYEISSRNPAAPAQLIAHYDAAAWLAVSDDGVGTWDGPRGSLALHVTGPDGTPVTGALCSIVPDVPAAYQNAGDMGMSSDSLGRCSFPNVGATWYTASAFVDVGPERHVGEVRVFVNGDSITDVDIVIAGAP